VNYDELIFNTALANGMPQTLAAFITAQASHETATSVGGVQTPYTSHVFVSCNNFFGYKYRGQSLSSGACLLSPEGDYYARYDTPDKSVIEICRWINRRQNEGIFPEDLNTITTPEQYAELLKAAGYYGDTVSNYTSGLVYWLSRISAVVTAPATGVVLLVILALGVIAYRKKLF
jgi:mannosyl-glycoprotein endo-beta-N-acetylglucosaminidase